MDIYVADTKDYTVQWETYLPLLPTDRQERIRRAPTEEKRLLNLCAGVLLRSVAGDAPILTGAHGKPYLKGGPHFSLSHAGHLAVLAVSDAPVGVDVEFPRPVKEGLARRFFRLEEQAWLAEDFDGRFFYLWTRKEAVIKCCGRGLSLPLTDFAVLPENAPTAEGITCTLTTLERKGHILSVASAAGDTKCRLIPFKPEE